MTQSAQPVYQPLNAHHHHLTYAAHSSPLAPPAARLQSYRQVEGPSFPDVTREDESQNMMLKMALSNLLDPGESEQYKYYILLDHLKVDQAKRLARAYVHAPDPSHTAILHGSKNSSQANPSQAPSSKAQTAPPKASQPPLIPHLNAV